MPPDVQEFLTFVFGVVVAAMVALAASAARAESPLGLVPQPVAKSETIMLSDVFTGIAEGQDAALSSAPAPGRTVTFDPIWLAERVNAEGLSWTPPQDLIRVQVRSASDTIPHTELEDELARTLAAERGGLWRVALGPDAHLSAREGTPRSLEVISARLDGRRLTANLRYGPTSNAMVLRGQAERVAEVPVLTRPLSRGARISAADLDWEMVPENRLPQDAILSADDLIGMEAKRALRSATALRTLDLRAPLAIAKGDTVLLVYKAGALTLTTRARALSNAASGEPLRLVNVQSNRTVDAIAEDDGVAVAVSPTSLNIRSAS